VSESNARQNADELEPRDPRRQREIDARVLQSGEGTETEATICNT
jgi:hypothetical protein